MQIIIIMQIIMQIIIIIIYAVVQPLFCLADITRHTGEWREFTMVLHAKPYK